MESNVSNVRSIPLFGVLVVNMLSEAMIINIITINQSYISLSREKNYEKYYLHAYKLKFTFVSDNFKCHHCPCYQKPYCHRIPCKNIYSFELSESEKEIVVVL